MTVWGGETPGLEITPSAVALTLGPAFLVNGAVIGLLHWRYVRGYRRRLAARGSSFYGAHPAPRTPVASSAASTEAKVSD